ncbi:hypothetical protein BDF21DRAFT_399683 [Thamnidium elegans]|nr:hypothetical protein BDF21DRAFT_399683 [Thamnidium elegans]
MTPFNILKTISDNKNTPQETDNEPKEKLKIKELSRILSKLIRLRNLTRKKLETKGICMMLKVLPSRNMKIIRVIQDLIYKETDSPRSSPAGPTTKFVDTAKNVIFPTDAVIEKSKVDHDLVMGSIEQLREE